MCEGVFILPQYASSQQLKKPANCQFPKKHKKKIWISKAFVLHDWQDFKARHQCKKKEEKKKNTQEGKNHWPCTCSTFDALISLDLLFILFSEHMTVVLGLWPCARSAYSVFTRTAFNGVVGREEREKPTTNDAYWRAKPKYRDKLQLQVLIHMWQKKLFVLFAFSYLMAQTKQTFQWKHLQLSCSTLRLDKNTDKTINTYFIHNWYWRTNLKLICS